MSSECEFLNSMIQCKKGEGEECQCVTESLMASICRRKCSQLIALRDLDAGKRRFFLQMPTDNLWNNFINDKRRLYTCNIN